MQNSFYLVLDLGTTGVKALLFDARHAFIGKRFKDLEKSRPKEGHVEQDPMELVETAEEVMRGVVEDHAEIIGDRTNIKGIGIATQRETVILWHRETGEPALPALVWEDMRTERVCEVLAERHDEEVRALTGLPMNPYSSATKLKWALEHTKDKHKTKDLLFGTPDSWMLYNLAEGRPHITDFTNASRTLLFNIKDLKWDEHLLDIFGIPGEVLPKPQATLSDFGLLREDILGAKIPILAVSGDQQASLYAAGQVEGTTKVTYGTGTFVMQIIGEEPSFHDKFSTTLAVSKKSGETLYAVEARVDMGSAQVSPLLGKPGLKEVIREIALAIDEYIQALPEKPERIVIDGGITQYKGLDLIQKEISGVNISPQLIYNGTALGIAKMLIHSH